ncbi:unnamed protein product [Polarella glacialis]|uniref:PAS domain-containing protein n=1 Tax=Polarella glacialis TaxID=89957 RepID=A0A813G1A5_POLGL|nr:unnamed protein product [Polarella glacialis]
MRGSFLKSGAAVKGNLPSWGHKLLRDSLSTQGCFSIGDADVTDEGYTIRYASPGFCDLFKCELSDCLGKRCCSFVGYNGTAGNLSTVAKTQGMELQEAKTRAQFALKHFVQQGKMCSGTWDRPSSGIGYALVLASDRGGEPFVCEIVLSSRTELRTSWGYTVILHRDATNEVPVRKLLEAACPGGGFDQLVHEQKLGLLHRLASSGIDSKSAVLCFQQKALNMWTGKILDQAQDRAVNYQGPFPAWEYMFMLDHLSTQQSFILSDAGVTYEGVTVRYASPGCCELFELDFSDLAVTRCQKLLGYQCVSRHVRALAAQLGMDLQQVKERLQFVHDFLVQQANLSLGSWDKPSSHVGFAVALAYKAKGGTFFVAEYEIMSRTEPHTGWPYFASFHRDVTNEVSVKRLLQAACSESAFEQLVQEQKSRNLHVFASSGIHSNRDGRALQYLREKILDVWIDTVKDALWTPGSDSHPTQSRSRSKSPDPNRLPDWAYTLIQRGLCDRQSFTICDNDMTDEGLTVLYASSGFCDLFECDSSELLGTRCCYQCDTEQTVIAADALGMGVRELKERIQFTHKYFVQQSAEQVGFALLLACTRSGALFVCAVTLMTFWTNEFLGSRTEDITGWHYTTLLQMDVTDIVGIRQLIEAACPAGGFDQLVQESRSEMLQCLKSSGIPSSNAAPPFQRQALERWTGQMMDVVQRDQNPAAAKALRAPPPSFASDGSQQLGTADDSETACTSSSPASNKRVRAHHPVKPAGQQGCFS